MLPNGPAKLWVAGCGESANPRKYGTYPLGEEDADTNEAARRRRFDSGSRRMEDDEFETVHHAKPKFKPLPRQACQQDSRLVARVCDLARRGLTLVQIDAHLHEEGAWIMTLRPHLCP